MLRLQDVQQGGFQEMVKRLTALAEEKLASLNRRKRESCPVYDLVVGVQCGGSDSFSGVTANPAVGYAADMIVRAGGTVMFSEVTEVRDAIHLLTPRAADEEVGRALIREMDWYDNYLESGRTDRSANPTPGNKLGRAFKCRGKSPWFHYQVGKQPNRRCLEPWRARTEKGAGVCRHSGQ